MHSLHARPASCGTKQQSRMTQGPSSSCPLQRKIRGASLPTPPPTPTHFSQWRGEHILLRIFSYPLLEGSESAAPPTNTHACKPQLPELPYNPLPTREGESMALSLMPSPLLYPLQSWARSSSSCWPCPWRKSSFFNRQSWWGSEDCTVDVRDDNKGKLEY